uniref:Uncharacterized protein n=1 Tax=Anguilla anguilla TaxID=7936 RepID=A0A0E9P709_ANGAN
MTVYSQSNYMSRTGFSTEDATCRSCDLSWPRLNTELEPWTDAICRLLDQHSATVT